MIEYYLVDVSSIYSTASRSQFDVNQIEALAKSILSAGGLVSPLLLNQLGHDKYEVMAGDLEYYAALRAKEIDPRKGEVVSAFIIPPKLKDSAIEQLRCCSSSSDPFQPSSLNEVDLRINQIESRLNMALRDLDSSHKRDIKRLDDDIDSLKAKLPQRIEPLEAFNSLSLVALAQKLATANVRGKTAKRILDQIEVERQREPFNSFADMASRLDGLSAKRILNILDIWSGLL